MSEITFLISRFLTATQPIRRFPRGPLVEHFLHFLLGEALPINQLIHAIAD